jgi:hypothetical protein
MCNASQGKKMDLIVFIKGDVRDVYKKFKVRSFF